jgi:hypothetical protein
VIAVAFFTWIGPQVLTMAIPLGVLSLVILVGFFVRRPRQWRAE